MSNVIEFPLHRRLPTAHYGYLDIEDTEWDRFQVVRGVVPVELAFKLFPMAVKHPSNVVPFPGVKAPYAPATPLETRLTIWDGDSGLAEIEVCVSPACAEVMWGMYQRHLEAC